MLKTNTEQTIDMSDNDIEQYIADIRKAMDRETALSRPKEEEKPSPAQILIAAREIMKRAKDARSNKNNR
mgnify:FL=1